PRESPYLGLPCGSLHRYGAQRMSRVVAPSPVPALQRKIAVLLGGPIEHDGRVVKVVRSLRDEAKIDLYCLGAHSVPEDLFEDGVRLFSRPPGTRLRDRAIRNTWFHLEHASMAKWVLASGVAYDVIYANDLPTLYPAVSLKRALGARLVYDSH